MNAVGRNEPCPCGSGLKFKRCCLKKEHPRGAYTSAERDSALAKLMRFSARSEFDENQRTALELFWGDWLSEEPDEELEQVMDSEQVNLAYHSWFVFDFDLGEGRTMFDLFLEREAKKLNSGECNYFDGMRGSHIRLYEILEVKVDQGFDLRDLWDDRRLWVRERRGTRELATWDVIAGRLGRGAGGEAVFETIPHVYPATVKDDLLKGLRKAHRLFMREFPERNLADFFRSMAPVFHQVWLEQVVFRPAPKIMTSEGDSFVFAKVIFDLLDRDALTAALAGHPDIVDHGEGSYAWLEDAGAFQRSVGTIVVEDRRVMFETTSRQRAERGKEFLQRLLGDAVRFRVIAYEDVGQALKRAPARPKDKMPEIPPEVQAEVLGRFYEKHYRKWLDEPVPALGDRTPRHAAKLKTVRPKLITLLKDFESHSERQRRAGEPAYDFGWMWKELGLTRE
ncbi:MAG TPA: SEC-C domain-containing protein [Candidatus Binatia bacterium]|nr:SEC-C domain-containing protein [Candidatus Binatia bacterium]